MLRLIPTSTHPHTRTATRPVTQRLTYPPFLAQTPTQQLTPIRPLIRRHTHSFTNLHPLRTNRGVVVYTASLLRPVVRGGTVG